MRMVVSLLLLDLLLLGCTTPTPYQPANGGDGYTERQIEPHRYRVSFRGNSRTSREVVETYLIYRAAELTLADGMDYFRVADGQTEIETRYRTTVSTFGPVNYGYGFRHGFYQSTLSGVTTPISRYEAIANIVTHEGQKPNNDPDAYDAADVITTLSPLIQLPDAKP